MATVKLNEAALFKIGFDRVAIDALRHLFVQVGDQVGAPTLPQLVKESTTVIEKIAALDDLTPPAQDSIQPQNLQSVILLELQISQMRDEIAQLSRAINDIRQGVIV